MLARIFSALTLRVGISVTIESKKPYCVRWGFGACTCTYVCIYMEVGNLSHIHGYAISWVEYLYVCIYKEVETFLGR